MLLGFPRLFGRNGQVFFLAALFSLASVAQSPTQASFRPVPDRILGPVDSAVRAPLPNHLPLWANAENDRGPASGRMQLTLVLARSAQQQHELDKLLADQKNPASPDFHRWLSPEEVGARFGLSSADMDAVRTWAQSEGLKVDWVSPSRTFIGLSGEAEDVGRAFDTEVRTYSVRDVSRNSVATTPKIPAALAPVISSVYGLYSIPDRPSHLIVSQAEAKPNLTLSNGIHYITPLNFNTIYDATGYYWPAQATIGIVGRSRTDSSDFYYFSGAAGVSVAPPEEVVPTAFGGVDPGPAYTSPPAANVSIGDQSEATLDVTRAGTVSPSAKTLLVVATQKSGGIEADAQYLVQTSPIPAPVISISFGACESEAGPSGVNFWNTLFEQASLEGITVLVASGDSGASGCEQAFTTPTASPQANSPNYICSSPYATCVGGTQFNDTTNPSQYWNSKNGTQLQSALGYIPEGGWNEPLDGNGTPVLAASGGGVSAIIPTPAWQSGPGVPAARAGRYTPDVSFSGSCHTPYFACFAAGGASCVADSTGAFRFIGFCGTSASAPSMAGVIANLDLQTNMSEGNINPELYAMAQNQPSSFHDATPATSGVTSCSLQTPSMCNNSAPGPSGLSGGQAGYALNVGYDEVTGLGSLDIAKFLQNFASALPAPAVTLTPSATTINAGDPLTVTVTVAGAAGQPTPTGWVQLTNPQFTSSNDPLVSGSVSFSIGADVLAANSGTFTANYVPDDASSAIYAHAIGKGTVTIQYIQPTITAAFSPASPSTAQNIQLTVKVAGVSGVPAPTGTVKVLSSGGTPLPDITGEYFGSATLSSGTAVFNIPAGSLAYGTDSFDITYLPDQSAWNYYPQTSIFADLTVAQGPRTKPSISATASASSITVADPVTLTVKVTPASGTPTPTGKVFTYDKNGKSISAPLDSSGVGQIAVPANALAAGNTQVNIEYFGDYNNQAAATHTFVTVTKANPSISVTPSVTTIVTNQSVQVMVDVKGVGSLPNPTGTFTITSGSYTSSTFQVSPASVTIPGGSLPVGTDTLTVSYSGDGTYNASTQTFTLTVTAVTPSFSIQGSPLIVSRGTTTQNSVPITVTPTGGFTGAVSLTASITSAPAGAQNPPTLSFGATSPVNISGTNPGTATLTVLTSLATTGALSAPQRPGRPWPQIGSVLACLFLIWIPAAKRRRSYGSLRILLLLACCGALFACGGGGGTSSGSSTPPSNPIPGTTVGNYVISITGTSGSLTSTVTIHLTVQ